MIPILYEATRTTFKNNGLGILSDTVSCTVSQTRNGEFELELEYPISGIHYDELALRRIVLATPDQVSGPQPFRIYEITKPLDGTVTVYAQHLAYDLSGIPVKPFTSSSAGDAMSKLSSNAVVRCPFSFSTDKTTTATMTVSVPMSIWALLGGSEGGILDVYGGGEYEFDGLSVMLHKERGVDRGVVIRYGKNLTSLKQEESCSNVYTGVYPYWYSDDGGLVELPERTISASGSYSFTRIKTVDFSDEWDSAPTADQLRTRAQRYMTENQIGVPSVSLSVGYAQLGDEVVGLCDPISVEFPALGVSATAECVSTKYDVLRNRYDNIEIGSVKTALADMLIDQKKTMQDKVNTTRVRTITAEYVSTLKASDIGAVSNAELQAGVASWMDANATPTTVWSKNIYNPAEAVSGWLASTGQITSSSNYWTTGFLPVSPGDVLTFSKDGALINSYYKAAYDSTQTFLSRSTGNTSSYTVPAGAAYARITVKTTVTADDDPVMICINNDDLTYESYGSHTEGGLGSYLILQSPGGKHFTLSVADDGTVSAVETT